MQMYHCTAAERLELSSAKVDGDSKEDNNGTDDPRAKLVKLSKAINNSKEVARRMGSEFAQLVFIFENVESRTDPSNDDEIMDPGYDKEKDHRTNAITPEMLVRRIVQHISSPEGMDMVDLNVDALLLLQKTIEDKEPWEEEFIDSNRISEDDATEREESYVEWQNNLNEWGVSAMIIEIISKSRSDKLIIATMELANNLLNGGNTEVQTVLYELLVEQKNVNFFKQMHERMHRGAQALKNKRKKRKYSRSKNLLADMDDEEEEFDPVRMELVGRMLQLFAEGHNNDMQNIMRDQGPLGFRSSYNLLDEAVNLLATAAKDEVTIKTMNDGDAEDLGMVLDFVIEVVQGPCTKNQELLVSSALVDVCKRLITADFERNMEIKADTVKEVKGNAVKSLAALLEGRSDKRVHQTLVDTIPPKIIRRRLVDVFDLYHDLKEEHYDEPDWDENFLDEGFDLLTMANALSAVDDDFQEAMSFKVDILLAESFYKDKREFQKQKLKIAEQKVFAKAHKFFHDRVKSIEISWDGNLDRIYFPIPSECAFMTDTVVESIKARIDYTSDDKKQLFAKEADNLYDQLQHYEKLHEYEVYRLLAGKRLARLKKGSYYLALMMNFVMLISLEKSNGFSNTVYKPFYMEHIQLGLGLVQVVTSCLVLFFLLSERAPLVYKKMERNMKTLKLELNDFSLSDLSANVVDAYNHFFNAFKTAIMGTSAILCVFVLLILRFPDMNFHVFWVLVVLIELVWCTKGLRNYFDQPMEPISFLFCCGYDILTTGDTLFYVIYVLCAFVGVIFNPIAYCFHLLDLVVMSASLQHVVKAITDPIESLSMTLILGVFVIYFFSMWAFFMFDGDTYNAESGVDECVTMIKCFFMFMHNGVLPGGGMGDYLSYGLGWQPWMSGNTFYDYEAYALRLFFDLAYFISVVVLLLNIIFGIILDTFGSLRENAKEKHELMIGFCFICGIEKNDFDDAAGGDSAKGFHPHITEEHNMWDYLFFLIYLKHKDKTEYTGAETYVSEKHQDDDTTWIPEKQAMSLQLDEELSEQQLYERSTGEIKDCFNSEMKVLDTAVKGIKRNFNNEMKSLTSVIEELSEQVNAMSRSFSSERKFLT
jgi:hypothetical protein